MVLCMDLSSVCHCDSSCFSRFFRLEMHQNNIFFIFKNLFLISTHQNNPKTQKKKSFEEEINFFEKHSHGAKTNRTLKLTLFYGFMIY